MRWWGGVAWTVMVAVACSGDPEEGLSGETDVVEVTFEADIAPILARSCASYGCHAGAPPAGGLDLGPAAYDGLVDVPSSQLPSMPRVTPGDRAASYLFLKLSDTQRDAGGSGTIMPPGLGLSADEVERVGAWIDQGAPRGG
jgi:hypothetical protein